MSQPERPVRHRATYEGVTYGQFLGWTTDIEYEPRSRGRGYLHVEADDLFLKLDLPSPAISSLTGTNTGAVIAKILAAIGWTDPRYLQLSTGDPSSSWPGISDSSATLLQLISDVLAVEFGLFYADADGVATYESRNERALRAVAYTIADYMPVISPGSALANVANRATFTKAGSVPQVVTDTISADPVFGFGLRPLSEVESPFLASDEAALARAQYRVNSRKDPIGDLHHLTIDNRTPDLLQALLDLDFSDRVQASEAETGTSFDGFVERLERTVTSTPYKDTATYTLSQRGSKEAFIIGTSLLSGTDVLVL